MKRKYALPIIYSFVLTGQSQNIVEKNLYSVQHPNVILILADDLGAGDLACTGHPYVKTPNIDRLAEEGIRFNHAYMAAAWCSPSRYSLMSGQFPAREFYQTYNLNPDQPTVTNMLKKAGYVTAHFGKWHMNRENDISISPGDFGIDSHFTTSSNGPGWTKEEQNEKYHRARTTDRYVEMTIDFIDANKDKPFYINLWVHPTHSYIDPSPEQLKVYEGLQVKVEDFRNPLQQEFLKFVALHGDINKAMQAYCADITAMDGAIGRLIEYLKSNNLIHNTLIVFTSDNGPGPLTNQVESGSVVKRYQETSTLLNNVGSAGDFRERKLSIHDGGTHVPWIVSWPAKIPKGIVDNESVICGVDWLPTIASVCNIEMPSNKFDGEDVNPAFLGQNFKRSKPIYWYENTGHAAILKDGWKGVLIDNEFSLFYLPEDKDESHDLKQIKIKKAEEIKIMLEEWLSLVL